MEHWFRMRGRCGSCGLDLQRGETDYFIGSMLFNLVLGEMVFAAVFVAVLVWQWPSVQWDVIQWLAPAGLLVTPMLLFPVSKLAWLGFDLALRPEAPRE
jgi:uncharacterized protein (DUF983 family)